MLSEQVTNPLVVHPNFAQPIADLCRGPCVYLASAVPLVRLHLQLRLRAARMLCCSAVCGPP